MKIWKKTLSIVLTAIIVFGCMPFAQVSAEEYSGICGANATWSYDTETKIFKISGEGEVTSTLWFYDSAAENFNYDENWIRVDARAEMTRAEIGPGITSLPDGVFCDCPNLTHIIVDENNEYYASKDGVLFNKGLTELWKVPISSPLTVYEIPDSVSIVKEVAFQSCADLESLFISENVREVSEETFLGIPFIKSFNVDENNEYYSSKDGVLFNKDMTELVRYPLGKTENEYVVPNGVTSIGTYGFMNAINLEYITFPDSIKTLSARSISLSGLRELILPEGFEKIEKLEEFQELEPMFEYILVFPHSLESLTLPSTFTNDCLKFLSPAIKTIRNYSESTLVEYFNVVLTANIETGDLGYYLDEKAAEIAAYMWTLFLKYESDLLFGSDYANIHYKLGERYVYSGMKAAIPDSYLKELKLPENFFEILGEDGAYQFLNIEAETAGVFYVIAKEVNKKFGTDFTSAELVLYLYEAAAYGTASPPDRFSASCLDDSVQHDYWAENGFNHSLLDADENTYTYGVTKAPTCTEQGSMDVICSCGFTLSEDEEIPAINHSFTNYVSDNNATCVEDGTKTARCDYRCGTTDTQIDANSAKPHNFGDWTVFVAATCTADGVEIRSCSDCGNNETRLIKSAGHSFEADFTIDVEPTCVKEGTKSRHCTNCDAKTDETVIEVNTSHKYVNVIIDPSCTSVGYVISVCTDCEAVEKIIKEKRSHEDLDKNGLCDVCSTVLFTEDETSDEPEETPGKIECACICHGTGVNSFIYKLVKIFWKAFKINKACNCGVYHY